MNVDSDRDDYCHHIEAYLCRKNDGHLIRVVGPSFEVVTRWAADGIPLKVAFRGIDRYFERYYAKGRRRRPVKIDFCDADVLDAFDEWRRAVGLVSANPAAGASIVREGGLDTGERRGPSLPAHLERAVMKLTQARARGLVGAAFDDVIDRVAHALDAARADARGLRGDARAALMARLQALDAAVISTALAALEPQARAALERDVDEELSAFRASMQPDACARAREASLARLVRERFGLPVISFS